VRLAPPPDWCHTARVAFHETFWVVTGTAAPVIALAAVVSLNDLGKETGRMAESLERVRRNLSATPEIEALISGAPSPIRLIRQFAGQQSMNIFLQAALLTVSLLSIAFQRNLIPVWIAVVIPVVGVLLLALTSSRLPQITAQTRQIISSTSERPRHQE